MSDYFIVVSAKKKGPDESEQQGGAKVIMSTKMANDAWMLTPSKKSGSPIEGVVLRPKSEVSQCGCGQEFSKVVVKKHNCRACGDVYCGNCSKNKCMLKVTSGKKIKERVCNKCEELIDNDDHALLKACSEQEYHAGMGKFLDDSENDAGVANRSLSFVKYDGISKQQVHSPKPLKKSSNNFTFTNYLSPTYGAGGSKGLSPRKAPGSKVKQLAAKYATDTSQGASTDGDTELDTTANTHPNQLGSVSDIYFNESSADEATVAEEKEQLQPTVQEQESVAVTEDLTMSILAPNKTAEGYAADGSVSFGSDLSLVGVTPMLNATNTSIGASSTASTVLTNASIASAAPCAVDLGTAESHSYDHFVEELEGRGTEFKPELEDEAATTKEGGEAEDVVEDEKNASALDTSVLNDSNKSFSQKLLEVSSSEIDYDANSPLKEGTTRDSLNYESFGASPTPTEASITLDAPTTDKTEGEEEVEVEMEVAPVAVEESAESETSIPIRSSALARYGQESVIIEDSSALTFINDGNDSEATWKESEEGKPNSMLNFSHASFQAQVKDMNASDAVLLKGVKGCGGALESAREAVEAMEASLSTMSISSEAETVKDSEQSVVIAEAMSVPVSADSRALTPYFIAILLFAAANVAIFRGMGNLRGSTSFRIVRGSSSKHGEVITIPSEYKAQKWSLWHRTTSPKIWSNPAEVALQSDDAILEHLPANGFRIAHPSVVPINSALVRLTARLITRGEASAPMDPLVYQAMQLLRTPGRFAVFVQAFFRDPHVMEALVEGF